MNCRPMRSRALVLASLLLCAPVRYLAQAQAANNQLDKYAGQYRYQNEPDTILSFSRNGDQLDVETTRMPPSGLKAAAEDAFSAGNGVRFVFETDASGQVSAVRRIANGEETLATKISSEPLHNHFRPYDRHEVMIPMRDGVKLHAVILRPTDTKDPLPLLMQRTPYGVDGSTSDSINARYTELARSGYIFVMEDIRGRYGSEGQFLMNRPIVDHHDPSSPDPNHIDETTDAYD